ncbi:oligoendopeptidase F [Lactobacillus sp. LC28-10]|uniref:Oligopeptidase F n=1 Tax=Secundilactobacillus angelensis TaxID=2722706 RepID=A0ABX1KYH7_9LACO|nr:oligoendopeptidase F [Secundilactobacillus angelensis]MCH5463150.1 oligoendopeptidase F [Secundilactobacillus angelensis]NLR19003.1 oligoendopeptidase F [Secundilactobacillus angelensis]
MSDIKQLPTRDQVDSKLTWDLTPIFKDDEAFNAAFDRVSKEIDALPKLEGKLAESAKKLVSVIESIMTTIRPAEKLYVFASLKHDQDTANSENQALSGRTQSMLTKLESNIAWFEPELLAVKPSTLDQWIETEPSLKPYEHYLRTITDGREHVLTPAAEKLLAQAGDALGASSNTFGVLNDADLEFPVVEDDDGVTVQLTQGVYDQLIQSTQPEVRKMAFKQLYAVYHQFRHTLAATLSGNVKTHNFEASVHHYQNARQAAMSSNHIPVSVFDSLVTSVNDHLPLLHRYVALRKRILKLKELHMYDLYTPITGEPKLSYTFEEAKAEALKALAVLGSDYLSHVQEAFDSRWIDVVENKGKRSGAYSSGMYDTAPYILLNWQDNLESLFTLVHEMGHSMHSYYTTHNQPYQYGDYSIFVAEIASTTNETLLTDYLLNQYSDKQIQAFILNHYLDGFKGTVFRQTQFAEFEHFIHEQDAAGQPLTAEFLSKFYLDLNKKYYGEAVISDPEIADEWARIPHFYYNYYVYQYATGFAAANTLAQRITSGDTAKRDAYLDYLKSGSSDYPINVMQKAGVDMTQTTYLDQAFAEFEKRLDQFETLAETM